MAVKTAPPVPSTKSATKDADYLPGQLALLEGAKFAKGDRVRISGRDRQTEHLPKVGTCGTVTGGPYAEADSAYGYLVHWDGKHGPGMSQVEECFLSALPKARYSAGDQARINPALERPRCLAGIPLPTGEIVTVVRVFDDPRESKREDQVLYHIQLKNKTVAGCLEDLLIECDTQPRSDIPTGKGTSIGSDAPSGSEADNE